MLEVLKKYKWLVTGIIAVLILSVVFVFLHNNNAFVSIPEEPEVTDFFVNGEEEELNEHLSALVAKDKNANYESKNDQTRFVNAPSYYAYDTTEPWWTIADGSAKNGAAVTAFATAISVLSERYLTPASIGYTTKKQEIWDLSGNAPNDLIEKLADYYGLFFREVPAMNSKILNYYLDQDAVVIIYGKGNVPYSSDGSYLVVLGGYPSAGSYLVSSPTSAHYRNNQATYFEILSMLESDEKFYVLSGLTLKPDYSAYSADFNYRGENN